MAFSHASPQAQLSRLDALLNLEDGSSSEGDGEGYRSDHEDEEQSYARAGTPEADGTSEIAQGGSAPAALAAAQTDVDTNTILLSSHPLPIPSLFSPPLLQSLLALLDAYAPVVGWDPHPEKGYMRVVFDDRPPSQSAGADDSTPSNAVPPATEAPKGDASSISSGIARIMGTLGGLPLETDAEDYTGPPPALSVRPLERVDITRLLPSQLSGPLPSLALPGSENNGPLDVTAKAGTGATPLFQPTDHLLPPSTDRNFLISPPGSPPIGWEPIREDPPNRETLALDLMEALRNLSRDMDAASASNDDGAEQSVEGSNAGGASSEAGLLSSSAAPIQVVIPADEPIGAGAGTIPVPAVTVQSFDSPSLSSSGDVSPQKKRDITMVKATVESMRGDTEQGVQSGEATPSANPSSGLGSGLGAGSMGGGKRITPTGRPPLA